MQMEGLPDVEIGIMGKFPVVITPIQRIAWHATQYDQELEEDIPNQ
jgi:hypothetical protein